MQNQEENMKFSFRVEIMKSKAKEKAKSLIQLFALLHKEIARMPLKFMLFPLPAVKYANKNISSTKRHSQIQRTRNRSNRTKKKSLWTFFGSKSIFIAEIFVFDKRNCLDIIFSFSSSLTVLCRLENVPFDSLDCWRFIFVRFFVYLFVSSVCSVCCAWLGL